MTIDHIFIDLSQLCLVRAPVTEQGVEATVDEEEVQPGGAGDDHLPGPDTGGPADSPHYGLLGHRQEADGHEHRQAQAPFLPGRRKEVTFREELEEYPRRFLKNVSESLVCTCSCRML